jgi:acetyl esterase/lipase
MNKKAIIIAISILVILIASAAAFFIFQPKCGNGTCDSIEQSNPNLCPKDCEGKVKFKVIKDIAYGNESIMQKLDLYLPNNPANLIVFIHGGGFEGGDKFPIPKLLFLLDEGYAVASLNYRLSDEAPFPAAVYDVKSAIRFLRANGDKYNIDTEKIGVIGGSAGGYFVAFLGTTSDIKEFDIGDNLEYSSAVQAVVDEFGIGNFSSLGEERVNNKITVETKFIPCELATCELAIKASPITYITSNDPPFLILHGEKDNQIPVAQSINLNKALQDAGVQSELIIVPNAGHGGKEFDKYNSKIKEFFDKYIK